VFIVLDLLRERVPFLVCRITSVYSVCGATHGEAKSRDNVDGKKHIRWRLHVLVVEKENERRSAWRFIAGDGREMFNFGGQIIVCQMWLERALSVRKGTLAVSLGYSPHEWSIIASWIPPGVLSICKALDCP
jgi:hypothetical protein